MSVSVAIAKREGKLGELRKNHAEVCREFDRPAIGLGGVPAPYIAERRGMLEDLRQALEEEMAELNGLSDAELIARFNPPPPPPVYLEDVVNRGQMLHKSVTVSIDGKRIAQPG